MLLQIAIAIYPGFTALDAIGPYEILKMIPESEIRFVSNQRGPINTDRGFLIVHATHSFEETPSPHIILIPGSESKTDEAMANQKLLQWIQKTHQTSKWTLSVCSGALILGKARVLEGHSATTHWIVQDALRLFGAFPQRNQRIVRSKKIVTAAGVSAGLDLALWLIGEICGSERAQVIQLLLEYDPQPPYHTGHPSKASLHILQAAIIELFLQKAKSMLFQTTALS
ncbi:MAG: DJ-1/PfpI family protein [Verrucomicrobiota bacterium]